MYTNKMASDGDENVSISSSWPREIEAREYLKKHQILELLDNLTSQLIYHRPDKPKEFLVDQLLNLQQGRAANLELPCLLDESNIISVFGMMDPTDSGYITLQEYKQALWALGIRDYSESPVGTKGNLVSKELFSKEAKKGLDRMSATFEKD